MIRSPIFAVLLSIRLSYAFQSETSDLTVGSPINSYFCWFGSNKDQTLKDFVPKSLRTKTIF